VATVQFSDRPMVKGGVRDVVDEVVALQESAVANT